jgi:predicted amidohydrolase YtcJ
MFKSRLTFLGLCLAGMLAALTSCKSERADMVMVNGLIHTLNDTNLIAQAVAIKDGRIAAVGTTEDILFSYAYDTLVDLQGAFLFPGFIDAHCHFLGYAMQTYTADLVGTHSWAEVVMRVDSFAAQSQSEWIIGRGWDQNDWPLKEFPNNDLLNERFPDRPVLLTRVDGHSAIANDEALRRASITAKTTLVGGLVVTERGRPTGVLVDNAVDLVNKVIPQPSQQETAQALLRAQYDLFSVGITTVSDAGLAKNQILLMDSLQKKGELMLRVYAMASPDEDNLDFFLGTGPLETDRMHVCSFKFYADGALGSRGACLLQPYRDANETRGFLLHEPEYYREMAKRMHDKGFQMNTHCIGDSAVRLILDVYAEALGGKNDLRWRIEHAQVVDSTDMPKFGQFNVVPSVQPVHATSDMYWAEDRLGNRRVRWAYAYKSLLEKNGWLACGSDFPVEDIDPMLGFYAAVKRQDLTGYPLEGFQIENALTRLEAMRGMTVWAAKANREDHNRGSIEPNKFADFVVLDRSPLTCPDEEILKTSVVETWIHGLKVWWR